MPNREANRPPVDAYRVDVLTEDNGWEHWTTISGQRPDIAVKTDAYVSGFYVDSRIVDLFLVGGKLVPAFEPDSGKLESSDPAL